MDLTTKSRGFTLIELLVTISIIGILSVIGLVAYYSVLREGRDSKRQSDLRSVQSALEQYYSDQMYYPEDITVDSALSGGGKTYLNTVPGDPASPPNYCYKSLKSTQDCSYVSIPATKCSNSGASANKCSSYCLYAKLENKPSGTSSCGSVSTYNLMLTPP